ncbi:MAG: apolipoprotein N-acyltransferase [Candidatus Kapabacteria bacterium]|jgi:apolipoprotein N-acyltransferase|nr:apolipoprotein N-acyltransferase [Candidatus Kapabacteria bacterium]
MNKISPHLYAVVTGLLLALSFPPMYFFFFAFIAFIPLLYFFSEQDYKRKYLLVYIAFFIYHSGCNWWIGSWQADSDPYLTASSIALAIIHPLFFMFPFWIFFTLKKRFGKNLALNSFPFIWTSYEWLHNLGELSYPWLTIGNTQIYNYYWVQFVEITGVWGASFLIIVANVIILKLINIFFAKKANQRISHRNELILFTSILSALITIPVIFGIVRTSQFNHSDLMKRHRILKAGIIQPAINPWRKWEISVDGMIQLQMDIADSLLDNEKKPELIIWNETAIPRYVHLGTYYHYSYPAEWVAIRNAALFTGVAEIEYFNYENKPITARRDINEESLYYEPYNSSILINPNDKTKPQSYRKMRLTPMAERLPYTEYLMFMKSWFEWGVGVSSWGIGTEQKNLTVRMKSDSASLGPVICIESIYPEFVSRTVKNGAEFIAVITNDAWYDYTPGPEQHFLISAVRAIENRRYIARCANTGVSGLISPTGETISRLPQYTKAGLFVEIPLLKDMTLYSEYGDWFALICFIYTVFIFLFAYIKKFIKL